jgi:hypothetical protein
VFDVALRFELGRIRDFQDLFVEFGDGELRMVRPWLSVGTVRVSAAGGVMLKMASYEQKYVIWTRAVQLDQSDQAINRQCIQYN